VATVYVIAPVFNEEGNMPRLLSDWSRLSGQLSPDRFVGILVDDGSSDGTVAAAEKHRGALPVTVLRLSPNQGPGAAFATAFEHVAPLLGPEDVVVTTEGDNTSRIDVLCTMIERLKRENLDVVLASPHAYGGGFSDTNKARILLSHGGSAFVRTLLGLQGINTTSSFLRAHRASAILALQARYGARIIERPGFESMVELLIKCVTLRLSISEVAMKLDSSARVGKSKMKLAKTVVGYLSLLRDRQRWS
jgi:dolichol-phosphate mannosyltransferase